MTQPGPTLRTAFSREVLPHLLFSLNDTMSSMLLTFRGKLVVQSFWKEMCKSLNVTEDQTATADSIATHTKHLLGGSVSSVVIVLPYPKATGEDYLACWVYPSHPTSGPARYFTLGIPLDPMKSMTELHEWKLLPDKSSFECIPYGTGPDNTPDAFSQAIEKLLSGPAQPAAAPTTSPVPEPAPTPRPPEVPTEPAPKWWQFWK